jgi:drug/metabolite transporter (DMT)-like permease
VRKEARTPLVCVLLVLAGVFFHVFGTYYAFRPKLPFAPAFAYAYVAFLVSVPIILFFLRGARPWRIVVFCIWLLYVGVFAAVMFAMH